VDIYLRFGDVRPPRGRPEYGISDEYLTYAAGPDGLSKSKKSKRGHGALLPDRMVTFADIQERGLSTVRTGAHQVSYSERGNLQGQQFWSVAGRVYELARARGLGRELPTEWFLQDIRN
jgi:hypothetical protein